MGVCPGLGTGCLVGRASTVMVQERQQQDGLVQATCIPWAEGVSGNIQYNSQLHQYFMIEGSYSSVKEKKKKKRSTSYYINVFTNQALTTPTELTTLIASFLQDNLPLKRQL